MKILLTLFSLSDAFSFSRRGRNANSLSHCTRLIPPSPSQYYHSRIVADRRDALLTNTSNNRCRHITGSTSLLFMGKPKSGSIVDSYQTVSVNCMKCRTRLFRYKKKNGTKSNLIKCYIERISEDCVDLVARKSSEESLGKDSGADDTDWICPGCDTRFGKDSMIHGRPAIKLVGGKTSMTKK